MIGDNVKANVLVIVLWLQVKNCLLVMGIAIYKEICVSQVDGFCSGGVLDALEEKKIKYLKP